MHLSFLSPSATENVEAAARNHIRLIDFATADMLFEIMTSKASEDGKRKAREILIPGSRPGWRDRYRFLYGLGKVLDPPLGFAPSMHKYALHMYLHSASLPSITGETPHVVVSSALPGGVTDRGRGALVLRHHIRTARLRGEEGNSHGWNGSTLCVVRYRVLSSTVTR